MPITYAPDLPVTDPNILVVASNLLPNADGSWRVPFATAAGTINSAGVPPLNAHFAIKPDGTFRLLYGAATKLYELTAGSETDRSEGTYTTATAWHFCQYGADTYACNKQNALQKSTSGAFASVASAPKALIVETLEGALILCNVIVNGVDIPNGIAISDVDNPALWTSDLVNFTNTAYNVTLTDTPGEITAAIRFRDFVIVFKRRGMYILQFIDAAPFWNVRLFSADVGCVYKDACIVAGDNLYFQDDQDFYSFDGATIRSIASPKAKKSLQSILGGTGVKTECQFDDVNQLVSFYAGDPSSVPGRGTSRTYNIISGEWGSQAAQETGVQYVRCLVRAPSRSANGMTGMPSLTNENRLCFIGDGVGGATFQNGHGMAQLNGTGSAVTAWFGDGFAAQLLKRIRMNADSNTGITVTVSVKRAPNTAATTQASVSSTAFSTDLLADVLARGHFFKVTWAFAATAVFTKWLEWFPEFRAAGKN